jgi:cellobiose phosphorylase
LASGGRYNSGPHRLRGVNAPGRLALVEKYRTPDSSSALRWPGLTTVAQRNLGASEADARAYERLASSLLFSSKLHRAAPNVIAGNRLGQSGLWRFGISGDLPIVLVRVPHAGDLSLVRSAIKAHAFWRSKGLNSDLLILNEDFSGYRQTLHEDILRLIQGGPEAHWLDKPAGVFLRRGEEVSEEERILFQSAARVVLAETGESLSEQTEKAFPGERLPPPFKPLRREAVEDPMPLPPRERVLGNGRGGFTPDGREYVIMLEPGQTTPAPWSNVIAGPEMGTVISESGGAYTWAGNAHEFRLTAWHNDPLSDLSGEAFYIRDEDTGRFWSPTPLPAPGVSGYVCRHGFGYSIFEHYEASLYSELTTYVAVDDPVKFTVVRLRNHSGRRRRISLTGFWELTMGEWRHLNQMHIVTSLDPQTGAILARNPYARGFSGRTVFAAAGEPSRTVTGNRTEFIGRNGSLRSPAPCGGPPRRQDGRADLRGGLRRSSFPKERKRTSSSLGAGRGEQEAQRLVKATAARRRRGRPWRRYERWNLLGAVAESQTRPSTSSRQRLAGLPGDQLPALGRSGYISPRSFGFATSFRMSWRS